MSNQKLVRKRNRISDVKVWVLMMDTMERVRQLSDTNSMDEVLGLVCTEHYGHVYNITTNIPSY